MRLLLLITVAIYGWPAPAVAQISRLEEPPVRPCGFHSPDITAARRFLTTNFDSLRFAPGERIADIGAQSGNLAGILSLFYDNIDMTLEDIDSTCLNPAQLRATMRYYYDIREHEPPKNFSTHIVIGTETSTGLPDTAFTQVFFLNTYHEVGEKAAILSELHRIIARGGTLYVTERVSSTKHVKRRDCGHGTPIERELMQDFAMAGFRLEGAKTSASWRQNGDVMKHMTYRFRKG